MRVVLDANVLVSALISRQGAPGKILQAWKEEQFDLVVSPLTLEELERILLYPKIREKYQLPLDQLEQFLLLVSSQAIVVHPKKELHIIKKDPSDNRYLECAERGEAAYLVTGDRHLLELEEYEGIVILPPAGFLAILKFK